jgi:hypothetical protein
VSATLGSVRLGVFSDQPERPEVVRWRAGKTACDTDGLGHRSGSKHRHKDTHTGRNVRRLGTQVTDLRFGTLSLVLRVSQGRHGRSVLLALMLHLLLELDNHPVLIGELHNTTTHTLLKAGQFCGLLMY